MDHDDIRCAYCGDKSTELDNLRPLITGQKRTDCMTEIAYPVPVCGKCNQSKGNQHWFTWILSMPVSLKKLVGYPTWMSAVVDCGPMNDGELLFSLMLLQC